MPKQENVFNTVVKKKHSRSTFDLSHDVKMSLDMGKLVPTYVQECIPGDKFNIRSSSMIRFAPLISPVMHNIDVKMEYFFVPNRILWSGWEEFITGSRNGKQLPVEQIPAFPTVDIGQLTANNFTHSGSLADYLGLPTPDSFNSGNYPNQLFVNALPFAAYQRIYDEYYRDENLIPSMYDDGPIYEDMLHDGVNPDTSWLTLRDRAWEHDYFTSCLPFAQKGEAVEIPINTESLTVTGKLRFDDTKGTNITERGSQPGNLPDATPVYTEQYSDTNDPGALVAGEGGSMINVDNTENLDPSGLTIEQDTSGNAFATSINDLRTAIKLQQWLETNARGGTRYIESIYAHFGVKSSDKRLQRPEFIGSSRAHVNISETMQMSSPQSTNDTPQGNMSGNAMSVDSTRNMSYFCEEHGYIIGLMTVLPKTAYFQGVPKHFLKTNDRLEYYFPEFAHLGEQEVKNAEIYVNQPDADLEKTFGYIPRYSEYRFTNSRVSGDFRNTLKYWHMARDFENAPALNEDFITVNTNKRIFAVQDLPDTGETADQPVRNFHSLYAHIYHSVSASRLMPKYGNPTL